MQGESRVHPEWQSVGSAHGPFWWNATTRAKQWERPAFLFSSHVAIQPGATVAVANPYDQSTLHVSFPAGCRAGEWHSIPAPPAPVGSQPQLGLLQQQQQLAQQMQQQQLMQQQQQLAQQQQMQLARQQAAAEAVRLQEELKEYQADDPDSDLAVRHTSSAARGPLPPARAQPRLPSRGPCPPVIVHHAQHGRAERGGRGDLRVVRSAEAPNRQAPPRCVLVCSALLCSVFDGHVHTRVVRHMTPD